MSVGGGGTTVIYDGNNGGGPGNTITFEQILGELSPTQAPWAVTEPEFNVLLLDYNAHKANPDAHHNRKHDVFSTDDHFATGNEFDVIGLTAINTIGRLVPTSSPGASKRLLNSDTQGRLTLPLFDALTSVTAPLLRSNVGDIVIDPAGDNVGILGNAVVVGSGDFSGSVQIDQDLRVANNGMRVLYHTHDEHHAHVVINPPVDWILDEAFDVDIGNNLLVRGYIVGKHALQLPGAVMIAHFDGRTPYTTDFDGTTIGHKGQFASVEGAACFRPGKFGKALQVADQTENMITNPSFENDVSGWSVGNGAVLLRVDEESYVGTYSGKLISADTGGYAFCNLFDAYAGEFTSVSFWYKKTTSIGGTGELQIHYYNASNAVIKIEQLSLPAGDVEDWTLATLSAENPPGARYGRLIVAALGCPAGVTFWIDGAQAENYYASTPYADGSMGPGHSWAGTPHASKSVRGGTRVGYDTTTMKTIKRKFTVGCWVNRGGAIGGTVWSFSNGVSLKIGT